MRIDQKLLKGGRYTAIEHPDGTFTILDIPLFGESKTLRNGEPLNAGHDVLRAMYDKAQVYQREGFAAPATINHHERWTGFGPTDEKQVVGRVVVRDLRKYRYQGREGWHLFGNLTDIEPECFEKFLQKKLVYGSIEHYDVEDPELDSFALSGSRCPFQKYPLITIGRVIQGPKVETFQVRMPDVAALTERAEAGAMTYLRDDVPPPKKKGPPKDEGEQEEEGAEEETTALDKDGNPADDGTCPDCGKPEGECICEETNQEDVMNKAADGKEQVPSWAMQIIGLLTQLVSSQPGTGGGAAVATMSKTNTPAGTPAPSATNTPIGAVEYAKLAGEIDGMKKTLAEQKAEKELVTLCKETEDSLRGWPIDDEVRARILTFAKQGAECVKAWAEGFKKDRPKDLPATAAEFLGQPVGAGSNVPGDHPALVAYSKSPEERALAANFLAQHRMYAEHGLPVGKAEDFVKNAFAQKAAKEAVGLAK